MTANEKEINEKLSRFNRTKIFILPLFININTTDEEVIENINIGVGLNKLEFEYKIYFKIKKDDLLKDNFSKFKEYLINLPTFIGLISDKESEIYIVKIPKDYKEAYEQFLLGNYSKIEENPRRKILGFWLLYKDTDINYFLSNYTLFALMPTKEVREEIAKDLIVEFRKGEDKTKRKEFKELMKILEKNEEVLGLIDIKREIIKTE